MSALRWATKIFSLICGVAMGVCLFAVTLADDKIPLLLSDPSLVLRILEPDNEARYLELAGLRKPGWLSKWLGKTSEWPPQIPQFTFADGELLALDLDKSWDGLNFCLTPLLASAEAKNFFTDGTPVGKLEIYLGSVSYFTSVEVAAIAQAYAPIEVAALLARYQPEAMQKVYPRGLWQRGDEDCRAYLAEHFISLKMFLATATEQNLGVLVGFS